MRREEEARFRRAKEGQGKQVGLQKGLALWWAELPLCVGLMAPALLPAPEVMNSQKASGYITNSLSRPIRSVLVIDDDAEALFALSQLMRALGVQKVRRASSAEIALEILQTENVSLIVSDYRLDGMDGVQFVERLRAEGNRTPVVMLSGAPDKEGVIRATRHERVDFFAKPFRVIELAGAMERLLAA